MIPNEYWQLEYIMSTGTQYIDTGLKPSYNLKASVKGRFISNTGTQYALGVYQATGINSYDIGLYNGTFQLNIGSYLEIPNVDVLQTHTYILDAPNNCTYIDDTQYTNYSTQTGTYNDRNVLLFARWQSSITYYSNFIAEKIKLWENDILIRDYTPVMRKSDNVIGLYDEVNNVFYTNSGTGTFLGGGVKNAPLNIKITSVPFVIKYITNNVNLIAYFKSIANCRYKVNGTWKNAMMYIKQNGTWKPGTPKIKVNGNWKEGG